MVDLQNVSKEYKESMNSQIRNRAYIRAYIGIVNVEAQRDLGFDEEKNDLYRQIDLCDGFILQPPCSL